MKKLLSILMLGILCLPLSACGFKDGVIAKINGEEVPADIYNYFYKNTSANYDDKELAKDKALERIASYYLVKQMAIDTGNDLTEEEKTKVENSYQTIVNAYGGEEEFELKIQQTNGISASAFKEIMYLLKYTEVTPNKISQSYTTDELKALDVRRIKHIQILTYDIDQDIALEGDALTEAKAEAEEVLTLAKQGENFDDLIGLYSQDANNPPNGYFITPNGDYAKELKDAAKSLEVGAISDLIEINSDTYHAYEIVKRESLETDEDFGMYETDIRTAKFNDDLQIYTKKAKIKKNKKLLKTIGDETAIFAE